jgi:hypothetical protein
MIRVYPNMKNAHLIMRIFTVKYDGMGLQILRRLYDIPRKYGGNSMQPHPESPHLPGPEAKAGQWFFDGVDGHKRTKYGRPLAMQRMEPQSNLSLFLGAAIPKRQNADLKWV